MFPPKQVHHMTYNNHKLKSSCERGTQKQSWRWTSLRTRSGVSGHLDEQGPGEDVARVADRKKLERAYRIRDLKVRN